jgi:hypothetical protein
MTSKEKVAACSVGILLLSYGSFAFFVLFPGREKNACFSFFSQLTLTL